jgi:hypothetical protein
MPASDIPQYYPVEGNRLYAGEYPGDMDPDIATRRLLHLIDNGIRTFIDLTGPGDGMVPYAALLAELEIETGTQLRRLSLPVVDMGTPHSNEHMRDIIEAIRKSIRQAPAVYVHCWGGIGRTGTAVGCWLRECGLGPDAAVDRVQQLYSTHMPKVRIHPQSPQTPAQKNFIHHWHPNRPL